jgi:hypothetical protein
VGAVCPNWARTALCGGREVTRVPTAITTPSQMLGYDRGLWVCVDEAARFHTHRRCIGSIWPRSSMPSC